MDDIVNDKDYYIKSFFDPISRFGSLALDFFFDKNDFGWDTGNPITSLTSQVGSSLAEMYNDRNNPEELAKAQNSLFKHLINSSPAVVIPGTKPVIDKLIDPRSRPYGSKQYAEWVNNFANVAQ